MTDTLRTRIAELLFERLATAMGFADAEWKNIEHETWLEDADAVIAELNPKMTCELCGRLIHLGRMPESEPHWSQCGHLWPDIDHTDHRCRNLPGHPDAHHCCCGGTTDE